MCNSLEIKKSKYSTKAMETSIILLIDQVAAAIFVIVAHLNFSHSFFSSTIDKIILVSMAIYSATCIVIVRILKIGLNYKLK